MAAPASVTLKSLTGDFVMNKDISDPFDPILAMQGVGWLMRKGIGVATITLKIKQYEKDGVTCIDIEQVGTAGMKGTTEKRTLDNEQREHTDQIFGAVKGRSRWLKFSEITDDFLKSNWLPETQEGDVIESYVDSVGGGWNANQIWGFQEVDGKRYYARNVVVTKGAERKTARLLYNYVS